MAVNVCPTALIVNDDPWQLELAGAILEHNGVRVFTCQSADAALQLLTTTPAVDIIITDLHMPQIDGWRFCRLLRSPEYAALNTVPVLVMSATFSGIDAEQITASLGANAFLSAPYAPEELLTHVHALLEGRTPKALVRVLLIEDSRTLAKALQRVLEAHGYHVDIALTGADALQHLQKQSPDIVIMDYHLPDIMGDQLLEVCKQYNAAGVAIMMTTDPTPELALRFMRLGADAYLRKPFDPAYLLDVCAKARRERSLLHVETLLEERTRSLHEAIDELQTAKDYAENIINSSLDIIVSVDTERHIIAFNKAAQEAFGYTREEVLGEPVQLLYADPGAGSQIHATTLCHGKFTGEVINRRKNGETFETFLAASLLRNSHDKIIGVMGVSRDITAQKRSEVALQSAKEAAEAANRAKSNFLANVSHEIRTPMNGIIGMTDLALRTDLSPEQREYLDLVKMSAEALLKIINDLLDFSKIEAGKLVLVPEPFALRAMLSDLMKTLAIPAYQKGLEVIYSVHPDVPEHLIGDMGRLGQIVVNLVGNAIKFTEQGEVRMDISLVAPAHGKVEESARLALHFTVTDTGIGIAYEKQGMIFAPFAQADGSTTRHYGGTGLGLSIATQLVHLMDGDIWVESTPGCGSTFHFTASFEKGSPESIGQPVLPAPFRVLLATHNATQCQSLVALCEHWGMQVRTTTSVAGITMALQEAREAGQPCTVVILDSTLAGWEELIEQLGEQPAPPPLLVLTPATHTAERWQWHKYGMVACVMKPVAETELWDTLMQVTGHTNPCVTLPARPALTHEKVPHPLHVLVAEDNLVNQRLVIRLLEKRGHHVTVAPDGLTALAAAENQAFDLILMDVQMPRMDGLEVTAALRARERLSGLHVPIIAMTAHAMQGDRERCMRAGMDAYITKPLRPEELFAVLQRLEDTIPATTPSVVGDPAVAVFEHDTLWARVGEDGSLFNELIGLFLNDYPERLSKLHEALKHHDSTMVTQIAHTLKGTLGNISAKASYKAALQLEMCGREDNIQAATAACARLEAELARLLPVLKALLEDDRASKERRETELTSFPS